MQRPRSRRLSLFALATLVALLAAPAFAVDGVVLIDQNRALAGNVTPGDAPGFPVTLSRSGSYRLSGTLTVPDENTNGVEITANNVTLDLNGFSISGPAVCTVAQFQFPPQCTATGTGVGVLGTTKNVTVRNGTVNGMGHSGISLPGDGVLVEGVHAESNAFVGGAGIRVGRGIVTRCTATANAGPGLFLSPSGTATWNVVTQNGSGVRGGRVVSQNTIESNVGNGIFGAGLAVSNSIGFNKGFGLASVRGYQGNLPVANTDGSVTGSPSFSLGNNLCDFAPC